jgi:hypothetical protein
MRSQLRRLRVAYVREQGHRIRESVVHNIQMIQADILYSMDIYI